MLDAFGRVINNEEEVDDIRRVLLREVSSNLPLDGLVGPSNNTSTDSTSNICQQIIDDHFPLGKVITKPESSGKGSALRIGVAAANSPMIITMDADMATDLSALEPAIKGLQKHHIVVGSRSLKGSQTQGISPTRRFVTIISFRKR